MYYILNFLPTENYVKENFEMLNVFFLIKVCFCKILKYLQRSKLVSKRLIHFKIHAFKKRNIALQNIGRSPYDPP